MSWGELRSHKDHWAFDKPANENVKIWRYLDFDKFFSVLDTKALFFSTLKKLEDKFEGSITPEDKATQDNLSEYKQTIFSKDNRYFERERSKFRRRLRSLVCVNCWSMGEKDSEEMWNKFTIGRGVAIQSTFKRLIKSFNNFAEDHVYVGTISYSAQTSKPEKHFICPLMHKFPKYKNEREIRALISRIPIDRFELEGLNLNWKKYADGKLVSVDLEKLIEAVYVSPTSERWFFEIVKSVVEKYLSVDYSKKVRKSGLSKKPFF